MTDPNAKPKPRLRELGQIYVTGAAAIAWGGSDSESIRRQLTEIALDAYPTGDVTELREGERVTCRARTKASGTDTSMGVVREGRLLVVVDATGTREDVGSIGDRNARRARRIVPQGGR